MQITAGRVATKVDAFPPGPETPGFHATVPVNVFIVHLPVRSGGVGRRTAPVRHQISWKCHGWLEFGGSGPPGGGPVVQTRHPAADAPRSG
ncbi:hypothetical protein GCM10009545_33070 [Saccharopolyspora thermophila]|uniref:Uncharacterized protein n=1 Tax=Saccharopolyspora thermophila TaxID=89367 RepID=A0ABP3MXR5_9PSEU